MARQVLKKHYDRFGLDIVMHWYVYFVRRIPFIHFLNRKRINEAGEGVELGTLKRAVRSVPASGEVWARYLRYLVSRYSQLFGRTIHNFMYLIGTGCRV
jgi:hypothetical protein